MSAMKKGSKFSEENNITKKVKLSKNAKDLSKRLIVVIENAHLIPHRIEKTGDKYELLTSDHIDPNKTTQKGKFKKKYNEYFPIKHKFRPDLVHQCLLMLFDSPLNHAGLLQVYVRTHDDKLILIHRETRMPRTYKRFSHLMANFLVDGCLPQVTTKDGSTSLLRLLQGPISRQIPPKSLKYKIVNYDEDLPLEKLSKIVESSAVFELSRLEESSSIGVKSSSKIIEDVHVVIYIEAVPVSLNIQQIPSSVPIKGDASKSKKLGLDSDTKVCCISEYPLTPTHVCVKVTSAFEKLWNIL